MTARQSKVANEVQHIVALALVQGRIPSTLPLTRITVMECWISADLRIARAYLQVPTELNTPEFFAEANAQLAKAMRKIIANGLATKYTPDISFWPAETEISYPAPQKDIMK
ncbi:MAG: ribosome-binding factor A [Hyphomicrobiales bacterium]|nr:MAG: ribosome-binding factor A [Hyphomicrobiales bacterium]